MSQILSFLGAAQVDGVRGTHELCTVKRGGIRTVCGIPIQIVDKGAFKEWLEENKEPSCSCAVCCNTKQNQIKKKVARLLR